jgi:hypothetical protein
MNAIKCLDEWAAQSVRTPAEKQLVSDVKDGANTEAILDERQQGVIFDSIYRASSQITHRDLSHAQFVMTAAAFINSCK